MSSFYTALSGLTADTTALDVVGDNLANMNTQGFKANSLAFEDAMNEATASLQIGAGVGSTDTNRNFSQGNISNTGQPLDLAIQGSGFFVVQSPSGQSMYTRDGSFSLNTTGQLVDANGNLVQGWMGANGVVNASGAPTDITVPLLSSRPPVATQNMTLSANLNANAATGDTFSTPIQVYDSLGNAQTLTVTFTNAGAGKWNYEVDIPGQDLTGGKAGPRRPWAKGPDLRCERQPDFTGFGHAHRHHQRHGPGRRRSHAQHQLESVRLEQQPDHHPDLRRLPRLPAPRRTARPRTVTGVQLENGGLMVATYSDGTTQTWRRSRLRTCQSGFAWSRPTTTTI